MSRWKKKKNFYHIRMGFQIPLYRKGGRRCSLLPKNFHETERLCCYSYCVWASLSDCKSGAMLPLATKPCPAIPCPIPYAHWESSQLSITFGLPPAWHLLTWQWLGLQLQPSISHNLFSPSKHVNWTVQYYNKRTPGNTNRRSAGGRSLDLGVLYGFLSDG